MSLGAVILAAGESARLGRPKQLIEFAGASLLGRAARSAIDAGCQPVVIVLGAVDEPCRAILHGLEVEVVVNSNWRDGMASSVAVGVAAVGAHAVKGVLLMVCDQPRLDASSLRRLIRAFPDRGIVAARYDSTLGTPAIFAAAYFPELRGLAGNPGAKILLQRHAADVLAVDLPEAAQDVDTASDLRAE